MRNFKTLSLFGAAVVGLGILVPLTVAQDRDRDDREHEREKITRIEPGTTIAVRTTERIDVDRSDQRIYHGTVEQDVRGENGRRAIPRGSEVELKVRVAPDNDLILDLEAVRVDGQRYSVRADADHVEAQRNNSLVGAIVGAVTGVEVRGRAVRVPRDSVLTFRLDRPMVVDVPHDGDRDRHDHDDDRR